MADAGYSGIGRNRDVAHGPPTLLRVGLAAATLRAAPARFASRNDKVIRWYGARTSSRPRPMVSCPAHVLTVPDPPAFDLEQVLKERFRLPAFYAWQREAIDALLEGDGRVLLIAPTGGGKSLCYQLPAVVLPGTTVVISPLIALMEDQVRGLAARGISATFLASTLDIDERKRRLRGLRAGEYKIVYAAPERLAFEGFAELIGDIELSLLAVDEAHCIVQWGHDFRPDYLRIGTLVDRLRPKR